MITFNEATHIYKKENVIIPNVTSILGETGIVNCDYFTDEARERGSHVHTICQWHDNLCLDLNSINEDYEPYFQGYLKFLKEVKPIWKNVESIVYNKEYNYIGTLDRSGMMFGKDAILDIKTGQMQAWTGLQIAAYEACSEFKHDRYGLQLNKNGTYKLKPYKDKTDFKIFLNALNLYNWKRNNK